MAFEQVAVYAEFRRDWVVALKSYETAYSLLQEVLGLSVVHIRLSFLGLSICEGSP
jgi:hypothetical protein